jgi:acylphosphatase
MHRVQEDCGGIPAMLERKALRIVVHGRVQGVWFRGATARQAYALGVTGWVRNLPDGSVQVHAEGAPLAVDQLVSFLHDGPPRARVDAVEIARTGIEGHDEFKISG